MKANFMPEERDTRQMTEEQEKSVQLQNSEQDETKRQEELSVAMSFALSGNLKTLAPEERKKYYKHLCEVNGLNMASKPFDLLEYGGKMIPYCNKDGAAQLRRVHSISIRVISRERQGDLYTVVAQAINKFGRVDESTGVESVGHLKGSALANAVMKAETKAKRRVTLSLAGLGFLDESETDFAGAKVYDMDIKTGEILEVPEKSPAPIAMQQNDNRAAFNSKPKNANLPSSNANMELNSELVDLAQLLDDLWKEKNKEEALKVIGSISDENKKKMKPLLSNQVLGWLAAISRAQSVNPENYLRV